MMQIESISAGYGSKTIVHDISAQASGGQFIALLGPNGSGKSTLIKTLCGLHAPKSGQVLWGGSPVHDLPVLTRARTVAYLAQHREAAPGMRGSDIIALGRAPYRGRLGRISADGEAAIKQACTRARVENFMDRSFDTLSGGEQARVLLARALAVEAPILLLDEPIAALDPYYQLIMMDILKQEAQSGRIVIAALHDLALAHQFADRLWVMQNGQLFADATPDTILETGMFEQVFGINPPENGFPLLSLTEK